MSNGETDCTVKLDGTPAELAHLASLGISPEDGIIVVMTEAQHRAMPGAGNIRDRLAHRRGVGDGLSFVTGAFDAGHHAHDLLDAYNDENEDSPYGGLHDLDTITVRETMALIRVTARCLNLEMKVRPEESGSTVTRILEEESLSPAAVFSREEQDC